MERIHADSEFMESIRPKLTRFFTEYIFPELLTNKLKLTGTPFDPHSQDADDSDGDDFAFVMRLFMEIWVYVMVQNAHINGFIFSVLDSVVKNLLVNGIVVIASILIDVAPFVLYHCLLLHYADVLRTN